MSDPNPSSSISSFATSSGHPLTESSGRMLPQEITTRSEMETTARDERVVRGPSMVGEIVCVPRPISSFQTSFHDEDASEQAIRLSYRGSSNLRNDGSGIPTRITITRPPPPTQAGNEDEYTSSSDQQSHNTLPMGPNTPPPLTPWFLSSGGAIRDDHIYPPNSLCSCFSSRRRRRRRPYGHWIRTWRFHDRVARIVVASFLYLILIATVPRTAHTTSANNLRTPSSQGKLQVSASWPPNENLIRDENRDEFYGKQMESTTKQEINFEESDFGDEISFRGLYVVKKSAWRFHTSAERRKPTEAHKRTDDRDAQNDEKYQSQQPVDSHAGTSQVVAEVVPAKKRRPILAHARTNGSSLPVFKGPTTHSTKNDHRRKNSSLPRFVPPPDTDMPPSMDELLPSSIRNHFLEDYSSLKREYDVVRIVAWVLLAGVVLDSGLIEVLRRFRAILRFTSEGSVGGGGFWIMGTLLTDLSL